MDGFGGSGKMNFFFLFLGTGLNKIIWIHIVLWLKKARRVFPFGLCVCFPLLYYILEYLMMSLCDSDNMLEYGPYYIMQSIQKIC